VNLYGADQLHLGLAGSWLFSDSLSASLEAQFMPALQPSTRAGTQSPAEITATVRHRAPSGVNLLGGAAVGAGPGAGAAAFRLFFGAGFGKINNDIPPDADGDGIVGDDDACPEVAEIVNGLDDLDGCPDALTTWRVGASVDGAPIDGATVTVTPIAPTRGLPRTFPSTLALTHSEELPGSAYEASANHGSCLAGAANVTIGAAPLSTLIPLSPVRNSRIRFEISGPDGQPIDAETELVHPQRACAPTGTLRVGADGTEIIPVGAGEMEVLVRADGFRSVRMPIVVSEGGEELIKLSLAPAKVKVESNRILILEKVFFDFNKASIQAQSFSLLEEVANTLRDHPQIASVEVGGHTDDKGNDAYNLKLSQERADAIRAWLVAHGIDASRLTARGYGEAKPIADNATEPGRDKNRRVEFTIVKWVDGS
jgi:outer membrane protein OmpA-like peptidoglycan-associated protein